MSKAIVTHSQTVASPSGHFFPWKSHAVKEFAIIMDRIVLCEPVSIETESRNFLASEIIHMSDGDETGSPFQISGLPHEERS